MRLLRNLSDIDKHRIIVLPVVFPERAQFDFTLYGATFVDRKSLFEGITKIEKGTELATLTVAVDISPYKMDMEGDVTNDIALPKSLIRPFPGIDVLLVKDVLEEIFLQCDSLLSRLTAKP